jgi:hypothetical protein
MSRSVSRRSLQRRLVIWSVPAVGVVGGVAYFVALSIGGDPWFGLAALIFMVLFTAGFVLLGRYSETVRGLMDRRDERITQMDLVATAAAGLVVLGAVIVLLLLDLAHGRGGSPYAQLGALGGVTYAVAVVVQRLRK